MCALLSAAAACDPLCVAVGRNRLFLPARADGDEDGVALVGDKVGPLVGGTGSWLRLCSVAVCRVSCVVCRVAV